MDVSEFLLGNLFLPISRSCAYATGGLVPLLSFHSGSRRISSRSFLAGDLAPRTPHLHDDGLQLLALSGHFAG
jgi:hypothetical protein